MRHWAVMPIVIGTLSCGAVSTSTLEDGAETCSDTVDNDEDSLTDCEDPGCQGFVFCAAGGEASATACQDTVDNDGDEAVDCDDPDCVGFTFCADAVEDTAALCADQEDNDSDGASDCADADCQGFVFCTEGTQAGCSDGVDNDGDAVTDCDDVDCGPFCTETSQAACADLTDNDGDDSADCADADCMGFAFCAGANGYAVADGWGDVWDGLPRAPATNVEAQADCADAGGRLPTVTEIYRNNATNGSGDLGDGIEWLWSFIRYRSGNPVMARLRDASVTNSDPAVARAYRCIWPEATGTGFGADRCHGPAGAECFARGLENVDSLDRPAVDYAAASQECAFHGASIPTTADFGDLIHAGLPNGINDWLWTGKSSYWYSNAHGLSILRWDGNEAPYWGWDSTWGGVSGPADSRRFRCIGMADPAVAQVPAPTCEGGCFATGSRRSPLVADRADRSAVTWATAEMTCNLLGGELPNQADFAELVHAGWPAGTDNWQWLADPVTWTWCCWGADYGYTVARWSGNGTASWDFEPPRGSYAAATSSYNYRCVWRPKRATLPICANDQVIDASFTCVDRVNGSSAGNANPGGVEVVDRFGNAWDSVERAAASLAVAESTCASLGGRLPTANEVYATRYTEPHESIGNAGNTNYLWTMLRSYAQLNNITVRLSDGATTHASQSSAQFYRCIWPASHGAVLSGRTCYGPPGAECQTVGGTRIADAYDRAPLPLPAAIQECQMAGGEVPAPRDFAAMIHGGWTAGTDGWQWMNESEIYYWPSSHYYYYLVGKWSGTGGAAWAYNASGNGTVVYDSDFYRFRCVYSTLID